MTQEQKSWIDQAPYQQLLERWNHASEFDYMFHGDTGRYYIERLERMALDEDSNPTKKAKSSKTTVKKASRKKKE